MPIKEIQEYKQVSNSVDMDLRLLKNLIVELEEIVSDEAFTAGDVCSCCEAIEELARAISNGVIDLQ